MQADGKAWLYAPAGGVVDGPLPAHYEPQDSPVANALYGQQRNPVRFTFPDKHNRYTPGGPEADGGASVYPYVVTTYRLTEHFTAGGMSRWSPYLSELQPEMFCEISPELAAERGGLHNGGWATLVSPRGGVIETRVLVTDRIAPLRLGNRVVHQIGLPYHWGGPTESAVGTPPTSCRRSCSIPVRTFKRSRRSPPTSVRDAPARSGRRRNGDRLSAAGRNHRADRDGGVSDMDLDKMLTHGGSAGRRRLPGGDTALRVLHRYLGMYRV